MKTLLNIRTSLYGAHGQSSQLAERFIDDWLKHNPDGRVVTRDLAEQPAPHLTAERFQAFAAKPEDRTTQQQAHVAYSDALIEEIRNAETIVLAAPMYNFSVPSTLRAYFDHIARAGVTFRYTNAGPEGLLGGKPTYVFITRGGFYADGADTQTPYLRQFLGFLGLEPQFVYAEGLAVDEGSRQKGLAAARDAIAKLADVALAA